ncbi:MAG: hypothetical protein LBU82_05430 [Treponema sp.]|jgi:hypothetical protein|nr:hypothetical protein [Treponema sp.]
MKRKIVLLILLIAGIAAFSYSEAYIGTSLAFNYMSDYFIDEDYGRNTDGTNFILSFHYFPIKAPLGFLTQVTIGSSYQGFEWKGDTESDTLDSYSVWDFKLCVAPSYRFRLGERVQIPLSLGPVFSFNSEEGYYDPDYGYEGFLPRSRNTLYYTIDIGLSADAAIVVSPAKKYFFIMGGLSFGWDFLHFEKGEMYSSYREFKSNRYKFAPYMGFNFSAYLGVGFSFDFD